MPRPIHTNAGERRFRTDRDGATAVEFAIVSVPFFALVFAIIETALVFFAGQVLESGVSDAARLVRTGQAQALEEAEFRDEICGGVAGLLSCDSGLSVDVRTYASFGAIDLSRPVNGDGDLDDSEFTYDTGDGGDIVVVRAFYEWPTFVPGFGLDMANLANGNRLLASATAFRNEPF